jgi:hypothetical protein
MTKPINVKFEDRPEANLRKLARALLLLVEEQSKPKPKSKRKSS